MGGTLWDSVFIATGMISGAIIVRQGIVEAGNELRQGLSEAGKGFMAWPRLVTELYSGAHTAFTSAEETHAYFLSAKEAGVFRPRCLSMPSHDPTSPRCSCATLSADLWQLSVCAHRHNLLPASARIHFATQPHALRAQQPALAGSFEHDVLIVRCNSRSGAG